jgi:bifunctional non-homologous end joining protein LigD
MSWFDLTIKPMLAIKGKPFDSRDYIFEIKWDGTRCISFIDVKNKRLRLQNRRLLDIAYRYPEFDFHNSFCKSCILDGEIVVLKKGKPDFKLLQQREQIENRMKIEILSKKLPAIYAVFDILWVEGEGWVTERPLIERKKLLEGLVEGKNIMISEYVFEKGKLFFEKAIELGFEGVIGKRRDSIYTPGKRSNYWIKLKKKNSVDAAILGYMKGEGGREEFFGSLILGLYDGEQYIYIGRVGTGFDVKFMEWFTEISKAYLTDSCPFEETPVIKREVQWLKPYFVCEVEFLEVSSDKKLRAPVFKRMRFDKKPEECLVDQLE